MLHHTTGGDRHVLQADLEEGELPEGAGRADAQRGQSGAEVKDEGDQDDHVRGGRVRRVLAAVVRGVLRDQVLPSVAGCREVRDSSNPDRPVVGSHQLLNQPAAIRHIQPAVPGGLPRADVRQAVPHAGLPELDAILRQSGHRAEAQEEPQGEQHAQDDRSDLPAWQREQAVRRNR